MPDREPGRLLILGAGPTGLGAGYRLRELEYNDFLIAEASDHVGGLASSERSANGFTYDIGGHVLFSHYAYFDRLFDRLMGSEYQSLAREAWIWMCDRFIPYPFQSHIRYLPKEALLECILGLVEARSNGAGAAARNLSELIMHAFGGGIARHFLLPYNAKVWAHPPEMLGTGWVGERMAMVDLPRLLGNVILERDERSWGPNATFKYPRYGGTGELFARMVPFVSDQLRLEARAVWVDHVARQVWFADGTVERYDRLLSTVPLDLLVRVMMQDVPEPVRQAAGQLRHAGSHIVGVGVQGRSPSPKCWIYYPEETVPFYRVTYLSNYSPEVVPDPERSHSLLAEVSHSSMKAVDGSTIADDVVDAMRRTTLLAPKAKVLDVHVITREHTYPIPSVDRDQALATIVPWLESKGIHPRGRFGAWRYEVGNMDHSVAQGVEWADRIVTGDPSDELTWQAKRGC